MSADVVDLCAACLSSSCVCRCYRSECSIFVFSKLKRCSTKTVMSAGVVDLFAAWVSLMHSKIECLCTKTATSAGVVGLCLLCMHGETLEQWSATTGIYRGDHC